MPESLSPRTEVPNPARWCEDPFHRFELRWWDGHLWTADVSDGGNQLVDPAGSGPVPVTSTLPRSVAETPARDRAVRAPGRLALIWGVLMAIAGAILTAIGNSVQAGDPTKSERVNGGLMMGIGGWLIIIAVIMIVVGLVRRARAHP